RLEKLRARLDEQGLDAILVSQPENRRYLSGFHGTAGWLLITPAKAILATDFRYVEQAGQQAPDFEVRQTVGAPDRWFGQLTGMLGPKRWGFEAAHISLAEYRRLVDAVSQMSQQVELAPTEGLVESLRAVKDESELAAMRQAIALTDAALVHICSRMEPGQSERQVAWELERYMRERGSDGLAFDTIVGVGPNGAMPHHHPDDTPVREGVPIVIDMGARWDGYCADMTRTVVLGRPDDTFKKVYDLVLGAQLTCEETLEAGMTGHEGDALARGVIEAAGYGDKFGHGTGHSLGLYIHEDPRLARNFQGKIENGMTVTVEPGIYLPGWGGVRIEDVVHLEDGRARAITRAPKLEVARL
ncbi:MAG: aminopeptidase P family protein, partial [Chloroflexi bacterium]|nr:aminopeptidase P family protein [Chloroflexota bacterium]